jgi:hypothetical protein
MRIYALDYKRVLEYQMRLSNRVEDHHVDLQSKSRRANILSNANPSHR